MMAFVSSFCWFFPRVPGILEGEHHELHEKFVNRENLKLKQVSPLVDDHKIKKKIHTVK